MGQRPVGSLRLRRHFQQLRRPTVRATRGPIRVSFHPLGDGGEVTMPLVGYAIDRKCGNAVVRNRLRRRLRALTAASEHLVAGGYLVRPEPGASQLEFSELATRLDGCFAEIAAKAARP